MGKLAGALQHGYYGGRGCYKSQQFLLLELRQYLTFNICSPANGVSVTKYRCVHAAHMCVFFGAHAKILGVVYELLVYG